MGRSPFVSPYGYGNDKWIQEMRQERQAREREAAKKSTPPAARKSDRDTLELSSRQPGSVQFAPVPIYTTNGQVDFTA